MQSLTLRLKFWYLVTTLALTTALTHCPADLGRGGVIDVRSVGSTGGVR
jgi:hypothetical protein